MGRGYVPRHGQNAELVQITFPATVQQRGRALPLPHSQHADAGMYMLQAPWLQIWLALHVVPQVPQWVASLCRSTQAQRAGEPTAHSVKPELHCSWQLPDSQWLVPFATVEQALLQALQFWGSDCRFVHVPLQLLEPGGHVVVHAPLTQVFPPGHEVKQVPHRCGSVPVFTHAEPPLAVVHADGVAALHVTPHVAPAQLAEPVEAPDTGAAHALAQLPQWAVSVCSLKQPAGGQLSGYCADAQM
jgi:hypothetical protein